jgi:hypothetical protein
MAGLSDEEVRHLVITTLTAPTARDKQTRIGASTLANGCDFCLASNFTGDTRATPITDRAWLGRTLGTAFHGLMESRIDVVRQQYPQALAEHHVWFTTLRGYGPVGGSIDLLVPEARLMIDPKGGVRKKVLPLLDYLAIQRGEEPQYGRTHKDVKLSEKAYAEEMAKIAYKVTGYFGQQNLYMHSRVADRASLLFFNRDGTGWFDNPAADRYLDPKAVHDINVLSFDYDEAYALALIQRGQDIWDHLEAGGKPDDFERNPLCFPCGLDQQDSLKESRTIAELEKVGDIIATFGEAA